MVTYMLQLVKINCTQACTQTKNGSSVTGTAESTIVFLEVQEVETFSDIILIILA